MILNVYSVFDSKLATFERPFYMISDAAAIRSFSDAVNEPNDMTRHWNRHPEDYSLFHLGKFNDLVGEFEIVKPVSLVTASSLVDVKKTLSVA